MRILFIGNSHTYYNDLPAIVADLAAADGIRADITMLAHPGWFLHQHLADPEASFNIRRGRYDFVVLQEHAHPFGPKEDYLQSVQALASMAREAGSVPVLYMIWAKKDEPENQAEITAAHEEAARETGAVLAPVGKYWREEQEKRGLTFFGPDGAHASEAGSAFAASVIWSMVRQAGASGKE